jgi:hypothetical protein
MRGLPAALTCAGVQSCYTFQFKASLADFQPPAGRRDYQRPGDCYSSALGNWHRTCSNGYSPVVTRTVSATCSLYSSERQFTQDSRSLFLLPLMFDFILLAARQPSVGHGLKPLVVLFFLLEACSTYFTFHPHSSTQPGVFTPHRAFLPLPVRHSGVP